MVAAVLKSPECAPSRGALVVVDGSPIGNSNPSTPGIIGRLEGLVDNPIIIRPRFSKGGPLVNFRLKIYRPKAVETHRKELIDTNTSLYVNIFGRDKSVSRVIMTTALSHESTYVIHAISDDDERPFAYSIHRRIVFPTTVPTVSRVVADYMSRGVLEDKRAKGVGTVTMGAGIDLIDPDALIVRSGTPAGIWSIMRTGWFYEILPFTKLYSDSRVAQDVLMQAAGLVRRYPSHFDINTGRLEADLREEGMNLAFELNKDHKPTREILETMAGKLRVNLLANDTLLVSAYRETRRLPRRLLVPQGTPSLFQAF